jgi:hypothetical protein
VQNKVIKLTRPYFLITEADIAVFMYKIRGREFRDSIAGSDIVLDGACVVAPALEKEFLTIVGKGEDLGVSFIIIGDKEDIHSDRRLTIIPSPKDLVDPKQK